MCSSCLTTMLVTEPASFLCVCLKPWHWHGFLVGNLCYKGALTVLLIDHIDMEASLYSVCQVASGINRRDLTHPYLSQLPK